MSEQLGFRTVFFVNILNLASMIYCIILTFPEKTSVFGLMISAFHLLCGKLLLGCGVHDDNYTKLNNILIFSLYCYHMTNYTPKDTSHNAGETLRFSTQKHGFLCKTYIFFILIVSARVKAI